MKEKVIRKKVNRLSLNELISIANPIEVSSDSDFVISGSVDLSLPGEIDLKFHLSKGVSANFIILLLLEDARHLTLRLTVIAQRGTSGTTSQLEMKALVLNPGASITFVPALEINEKNVSIDHKSTIGVPDINIIKYMQSRGISRRECIKMLKAAFLTS